MAAHRGGGEVAGLQLMLKSLTGLTVVVFEDPGFLTAISMYPQIGCKQKCQWIRVKQGLKFLCLLP